MPRRGSDRGGPQRPSNPPRRQQPPASPPKPPTNAVPIEPLPDYLTHLSLLAHSSRTLKQKGFVVQHLTDKELVAKDRCQRCNLRPKEPRQKKNPTVTKDDAIKDDAIKDDETSTSVNLSSQDSNDNMNADSPTERPNGPGGLMMLCKYHPGRIAGKFWTCCSTHMLQKGCAQEPLHLIKGTPLTELNSRYQVHATPAWNGSREAQPRAAVALDCEMGTAADNETEVIRLSMIDYFTGETLIDNLIWPEVKMMHLNTRFSGVTWPAMYEARRKGECINGVRKARKAIGEYVSPTTIVIGHSVNCDLNALRWCHPVVVDSLLLEKEAVDAELAVAAAAAEAAKMEQATRSQEEVADEVRDLGEGLSQLVFGSTLLTEPVQTPVEKAPEPNRGIGLKARAKERLGRTIQNKGGHDSVEDAIASRDLVDWHVKRTMELAEVA